MDTKIKNRQEWNYKVAGLVRKKFGLSSGALIEYISHYPQQRYGQLVCNYICPDYRNEEPSDRTKLWLIIFPKNMDFFYEEPWETFARLSS